MSRGTETGSMTGRRLTGDVRGTLCRHLSVLFILAAIFLSMAGCSPKEEYIRASTEVAAQDRKDRDNEYSDLSVPTQLTRIGEDWFIVDCYHDRIIYSQELTAPLSQWKVMTDEINRGHCVAGDGTVYLADDTEEDRVLVFEKKDGDFQLTQKFEDITSRPHFITYEEDEGLFYVWASTSGQMYIFRRPEEGSRVYLKEIRSIPELDGVYVRSFTVMGDDILFPASNGMIIRADKMSLEVKERYAVPDTMAGMVQVLRIDPYYYITVSTDRTGFQEFATIVRCSELSDLEKGEYEDVYHYFIGGGTPYVMTRVGDMYYLTEHRLPGHSIWRFSASGGEIEAETLFP